MEEGRAKHVAIIMDGNGRWAKKRGLPRSLGHQRGVAFFRCSQDRELQAELEALGETRKRLAEVSEVRPEATVLTVREPGGTRRRAG